MFYVQFFQRAVWPIGTNDLIEGTGDRSVIILDGRESLSTMHSFSRAQCHRRGYLAWQLFKGPSFTRSSPISTIMKA